MAKVQCALCGREVSKFKLIKLGDGNGVCDRCYYSANYGVFDLPLKKSLEQLRSDIELNSQKIKEKQEAEQKKIESESIRQIVVDGNDPVEMKVSREAGGIEFFDDERVLTLKVKKGILSTTNRTIKYDQIISFELLEDGETSYKGGLGMAAVGALTFGAAGAVVGSVVGKKKQKRTCKSLSVRIVLRNDETSTINVPFISSETKVGGLVYNVQKQAAESLISALQITVDMVERDNDAASASAAVESGADEIRKYKELADEGIISEEEYNAKKKQILGL